MESEKMSKVRWVKLRLVAEIAFNEWTRDRHLRHSEFKQIREDKNADEVSGFPEK